MTLITHKQSAKCHKRGTFIYFEQIMKKISRIRGNTKVHAFNTVKK